MRSGGPKGWGIHGNGGERAEVACHWGWVGLGLAHALWFVWIEVGFRLLRGVGSGHG